MVEEEVRKLLGFIQRGQYNIHSDYLTIQHNETIKFDNNNLGEIFDNPVVERMIKEERDFEQFYNDIKYYDGNYIKKLEKYKENHSKIGSQLKEVYVKLYYENEEESPVSCSRKSGMKWIEFKEGLYDQNESISFGSFDFTFLYYNKNLGSHVMYIYPLRDVEYIVKDDKQMEIIGTKFLIEKKGTLENPELVKDIISKMSDEGKSNFFRYDLIDRSTIEHTINIMGEDEIKYNRNYKKTIYLLKKMQEKYI